MEDKNECNSKTRDMRANHNNSHDTGEDTSQSGGEPSNGRQSRGSKKSLSVSPPDEKFKGKRHTSSPSSEPRSSKRLRLQYQPFQSPTLHIPQLRAAKPSEEKQVVYVKGEFLALRNESGSYFVCQAAQNVYKSSHRFRIRWLSKAESKGPDVYSRDFYDYTDFECVLTNIQMVRLDKNIFRLPKEESMRTEGILKKAINLENGINDIESDKGEVNRADGSKLDNQVEEKREPIKLSISARRSSVDNTKVYSGRQTRFNAEKHQPATRAAQAKLKNVILTSRRLHVNDNKGNKIKVKQKSSFKDIEARNRVLRRDEKSPFRQKKKGSTEKEKLKPNTSVSVFNKDPTFESNNSMPSISILVNSKLLIRAVLMDDLKTLQNMLKDSKKHCWIGVQRSIDQKLDALAYALLHENAKAIELIMDERQNLCNSERRLPETMLLQHNVGRSNFKFLGSSVRDISLSRGVREGNSALLKDNYEELTDQDYINLMFQYGVSKETLDLFCSQTCTGKQSLKYLAVSNLHRALWCGHRQLASRLIEDAMKMDGFGFNVLHKEVLSVDRHDLSNFRPAAIKKRSFGNCGVTPIHCAAINPAAKYLKQLIDKEADYNIGDLHMRRPIHYAAACEGPGPLDLLLSRGIKLDDVDSDGNTALHVAAEMGRVNNIELLMKRAKADKKVREDSKACRDYGLGGINRPNRTGYTPLHLACIAGHSDVVRLLLRCGADMEKSVGVSKNKVTPLMLVSQQGHMEILKYLIQSGAKLEARDKLRRTAVTHAIINGHANLASHLLRLGADPDSTDSSGNSLLHYAVAYGWWFCVKLLLDAGALLNVINDSKLTPLGIGFIKGHVGLVKCLLDQPDIDVDLKNDDGMTVVMLAVCSPLVPSLVDLIRFLIVNKKANCAITDNQGNTALHWLARNRIHLEVNQTTQLNTSKQARYNLNLPSNHSSSVKCPLVCEEAVKSSLQIAKLLLENDCDPSFRNHRGQTGLTLAIQKGNNELVKLLLNDGCQVTAEVDDTGENLLHALVEHSWETDLASLVQIIKDSPGKKLKSPSSEDILEINRQNPAVPLFENLDGVLRIGDNISVRGVLVRSFEKFQVSLIQGSNPEKDDVALDCAIKLVDSRPLMTCSRKVDGQWKDSKEAELPSFAHTLEGNDGKVNFELSITWTDDQFQVVVCGSTTIEYPTEVLPKQVACLHVTEGIALGSVQVQRSSVTKPVLPPMSLPSDVLREMAQTYSYDGFTPLLLACCKYHFANDKKQQSRLRDMIKTLVEEAESEVHAVVKKRSDNKGRNIDGYSALHFLASAREICAVANKMETVVPGLLLLLSYKPPINIQDHRGRTPLISAILNRQPAAAEALINAGAGINICSGDMEEDGQASPVILAAKLGLVSVIKLLLKHGANVQLADEKNHSTALHYAVTMKSSTDALEVVRCLVEAGININSANQDGRTPLHLAVNANSGSTDDMIEIEDLIIEKGADLLARDSLGRLPLHYAFVKIGRPADSTKIDPIEVVSLLTGAMKGPSIDVPDHYGQTPLHCAAFRGSTISCMHLAQKMSNLNLKDKNGNTALSLAVLGSHDSCAIMLLQKGACVQVEVVAPPLEPIGHERVKKPAWQWKPVAQQPPQPKRSPLLQEVVQKDWQGVTYMMLEQLQASGANYFPAIEAAVKTGKFKLALNLIARAKHWDKLSMCNTSEQNLLHILANMTKPFEQPELQVKVAQVLVNRGVLLNVADIHGSFPMTYAAINRNLVLCNFFAEQLGIENVVKMAPNKLGCTPLSALFWNLELFQWKRPSLKELRAWCQKLFAHGATCNVLVAYPYLDNSPGDSWAFANKNTERQLLDRPCLISPLIFAVCLLDYDLVTFLLQQGADVNFPDEHGRTPLMHAVHKNDIGMVRLLLNRNYCYKQDMWYLMQKRRLNKLLCTKDSSVIHVAHAKKLPQLSAKEMQPIQQTKAPQVTIKEEPSSPVPLLLSEGINGSVQNDKLPDDSILENETNCLTVPDLSIEEEEDKTMDIDIKQRPVVNSNPVLLTQTDKHGWTVIHHLIRPVSCGTYDNAEILYLLAEAGAPLDISNTAGFSPLQMAVQSRAYRLAAALRKLIKTPARETPQGAIVDLGIKDGLHWEQELWDYKSDSATVLERVESEAMEEGEDDSLVLPDVHSGMEDMGEVVIDSEQNIPYDVFMTKVDLSAGPSGCYSFFKMQVICQQGKNLYILFTRWGKLGTEGDYQPTPHCSSDDAVREFCRLFKAKSGNNWQDVKNFRRTPRKYRLVEALRRGRRKLRDIPLSLATDVPSKMPPPLQDLMRDLTHVPMLQEACQDIGIDTAIMPFGRLCEAALQRGRQILKELKNVVTEKMKLDMDAKSKDQITELAEKIIDLSSEYSQVVPQPGYMYEKVRPLENLVDIQNCLNNLDYMFDLELVSKILLGAQLRVKEINPLDYVLRAMDCQISAMQEDDMDSQYILQYIHNTSLSQKPTVERIYKVFRKEEAVRLQKNTQENRWLLWHGTSVAKLISVLTRGINVGGSDGSENAQENFSTKDAHFTDSFEMSRRMVQHRTKQTNSTQYVLLCEVSLGSHQDSLSDGNGELDHSQQTLKLVGTYFPDPACNLILSTGVTIPLGSLTCKCTSDGMPIQGQSDYSEYVVNSREQVCIRYIVCFRYDHNERHHKANKVPTHS